ncbi:soil-associated protein, TIGR03435 family [Granulicella rosea]|uniref:Soil-associated protein, TIGR03435 family n=1 Tax=Granulicella rosea TaxID=474952 RepID=A0A239M694_9BACT|nr:TIGR03435 family protein [Granulicella rosea]SNT37990.1 soil-associated protein, TIGR03435 family [Granulicella rosea]
MKRLLLWIVVLAALAGAGLRAQDAKPDAKDITGAWQGTLAVGKGLRIVVKFAKADGSLKATLYSIDQGGQPLAASSASQQGANIKFAAVAIGASYEGKLSPDGNTIAGTFTQGTNPLLLDLARATTETAWEIPAPAPPPKLMAADADPSFEVATIKPNNTGATSMQGLTVNGRNFKTRASSVADLIEFAYQVQGKQLVGGPEWLDKDRYDIAAVPDAEGAPNPEQVRSMIRKLLKERFQLTFHHDKRELSAYVLTVAKSGSKLTPTQMKGPLPGLGLSPGPGGITLHVANGAIGDFTGFLQTLVLDRPVVDRTGLTDRYDFSVTFAPDDSQFNGHPPKMPAGASTDSALSLFEAMQKDLGLKLEAEKTPVDVLVLDKVEKPSEN